MFEFPMKKYTKNWLEVNGKEDYFGIYIDYYK